MANRVADGERIYNERWSRQTREVFFWLLFSGADSLGMQAERPAVIAAVLSENSGEELVSNSQVADSILALCSGEKPALIRYESEGRAYLIFRKWQDWQRVYFHVVPRCPMPDEETLARLSPATRDLILDNFSWASQRAQERLSKKLDRSSEGTRKKLASKSPATRKKLAPTGTVTGTVSVTASVSTDTDNGLAPQQPAPSASGPEKPRSTNPALCWYYDAYAETLGKEPVREQAKHAGMVARAEKDQGQEACRAAFRRYLANSYFRDKKACAIGLFFSENVFAECLNGGGASSRSRDGEGDDRPPPFPGYPPDAPLYDGIDEGEDLPPITGPSLEEVFRAAEASQ